MKEDEREVLAHIVQNIDEQEIFLEFVAKAESIRESWQIAKIFEDKKKDFMQHVKEYDMLIQDKEKQLKMLTAEITEANNLLQDANKELNAVRAELKNMRGNQRTQEIADISDLQCDDNDLLNFNDIIKQFQQLTSVSVHIKNGSTAMARVAQVVYDGELYTCYQKANARLLKLREHVKELELTNKKLAVELRDLFEEETFKEHLNHHYNQGYEDAINNIKLDKIPSTNHNIEVKKQPDDKLDLSQFNFLDSDRQMQDLNPVEKQSSNARLNLDSMDDLNQKTETKQKKVEEIFQYINSKNIDDEMLISNFQESLRNKR